MRIATKLLTTALGGVFLAGMSPSAFACCVGGVTGGCNPGVVVHPGMAQMQAPVGVYSSNPFGHLKQFEYKNTPNVNIMRIYGQRPTATIGDYPSQFSGGCQPGSTVYCRAPQASPVQVQLRPAPVIAAPMPSYTPDLTPRQYGSTALVRGIAHVPTSIVDRSPITHIDGVPQPQVHSVTTAAMARQNSVPMPQSQPMMGGNVIGHVSGGSYTYQPAGGGQYWEKTSGPTIVDGLPATQILCRREAPRPAPVRVNIVRPVIGVPRAVPTPVRVAPQPQCAPAMPPMAAHGPMGQMGPNMGLNMGMGNQRYGSRWTY